MAIIKPNNNTISAITALPAAIPTGSLVKLSATTVKGNSTSNETFFTFIRLGDT